MTTTPELLPEGSVVTVGSFDGVHRGHHAVLQRMASRAAEHDRATVLVTFDPHPLEVVNPSAAPMLITTPTERREALAATDLDYVVFLRFDEGLRTMPPERFVVDLLLGRWRMRELVIGEDHGFGRGRRGDVELLKRLGGEHGFAVEVVGPVIDREAGLVSSTRIRTAVAHGDLRLAEVLLGRRFSMAGRVVPGAGRGREIGVRTANLLVPRRKLLPPDGVYAVWVEWAGGRNGGMLNLGARPTVGDPNRALEVHLFGFEGDLYGSSIRIEWVERLRDVKLFDSLTSLKHQLTADRQAAEVILEGGV